MIAKKRWSVLSKILFNENPDQIFKLIENSYADRPYHNLDHIMYCQRKYSEFMISEGSMPDALIDVAIWFHDIVYIPGMAYNEEKSCDLFDKLLGHNLIRSAREDIRRMILATKHNFPPRDEMEALIMDLDMAILGDEPEIFRKYENDVKQEYLKLYSEEEYDAGRKEFIQNLVAQKFIYHTDYFHERYEIPARLNLAKYSD